MRSGPLTDDAVADLVVRGGTIVTMDAERRIVEGDVAVLGGRIAAVGSVRSGESGGSGCRLGRETVVIDAVGCAVIPGMVNAHMHETLERGWFEDLPFDRWLNDFALPKDMAYEPRHMRAAALLNQMEMIEGGTTTFIDIFRYPHEAAEVAVQSGLRAVLSPQIIDEPVGAGEQLESTTEFVDEWRHGRSPLVIPWFGPHALYSCSPATFERVAELAVAWDVGVHTHLAESRAEDRAIHDTYGCSPAHRLVDLIGSDVRTLAAHGVHVSESDIDLLAEHGVAVAHCPTSNMKLGNGAAPLVALLAAGVTVGLGTDSNMTNNSLDMFEEMRQAALVAKLTSGDATALPCTEALWMATRGSARALGLESEIGSIEPGKSADVVVVDLRSAHLRPVFPGPAGNVVAQLVYAATASDVRTTIVAGRVLMEDRTLRTLDARDVMGNVDDEAKDLAAKAGLRFG